ncbi:type 1 restriction-modification system protein HsdS [Rhizobium phaseoli]|uniref:restriction endonuclease subunit S n=1 Tax=Rhizobium phaseoli TaxID=396 RepID=UPI0007E98069|nr:restriction endonuclease subunit S [Rhizobium phaseoli]ANL71099.1 type 1 restriction-modification system protein HsdS [Rhizobium phaseoli]
MRKFNGGHASLGDGRKNTKIGVLPASWDVVSLEDVTDANAPIRYGVVQIGPDTPGGVPIIPIKHIQRVADVPLHRASLEIEKRYAGSRVRGGDVLLSVKGTVGAVGVVPDGFEGNIAREIARLRPKSSCDADFLALQLEAGHTQRRIESKIVGSTRLEFSIHAVRDFPIALPQSVGEQREIAAVLRTWDDAIAKLELLYEAKEHQHRALTHLMVFGKRQFGRFRAADEMTPHRWFTLPSCWDCKPIGELANEISERNADGRAYEVLSCSKYEGFVRSLEYFKKQVFSADLSGYKKIWRGDFGFPSNHVEEGSIGLQNITDVGVVSPIYTVFRFASDTVNADYAFAVLKTGLYRHIFEVSTSASVDRRGSLRWNEFSKLPFPVPSLAEQTAIAEVLQTAQAELDILTTEINLLIGQKRGLMQKLLTGAWRVNLEEQQ